MRFLLVCVVGSVVSEGSVAGGLTLSYAETEDLVRVLHAVDDVGAKALFARFKYLQRMDYPHRPKVGRGSRVGYRFEDVLRILMVFQLMEVGIMPARLIPIVREGWPEAATAIRDAWRYAVGETVALPDVLVIEPRTLDGLGREDGTDQPPEPLLRMSAKALATWAMGSADPVALDAAGGLADRDRVAVRLAIDVGRLVRLVRATLPAILGRPVGELDAAFSLIAVG